MDLEKGWIQKAEGGSLTKGEQREEKGLLSKLRLRSQEFLHIIKNGKCRRKKGFSIYFLKNEKSLLGISISKKIKGSVKRHKIIRRIRELYWKNIEKIKEGKMVIIVNEDITNFSFKYLEEIFLSLI